MNEVKFVKKPWGSETIWAHTEHYVGKILQINAGEALSIQYHHFKDETMYVLSGEGIVKFYTLENDVPTLSHVYFMREGHAINIPPKQIHNVEAFTNMQILEASTDHLDDLVRLKDRYNRG
jgi:mannose-6-phosphate isomerase-like protein (cupin superfamily)